MFLRLVLLLTLSGFAVVGQAQVVINEILYNAPDDLDDLQYIELHNAGSQPVDLTGWAFTKGIKFRFAPRTSIAARGFVVICRNAARFKEYFQTPTAGEFSSRISHKGERLDLRNASGDLIDSVKFSDQPPWPTGADGYSGSLERISPSALTDQPANWVASPLSENRDKPSGTPGKPNAGFSAKLPPVIIAVTFTPEFPTPSQPIKVEAELRSDPPIERVNVLFRTAGPGFEKPESTIPMQRTSSNRYTATIPGQDGGNLIRFRVQAIGSEGAVRLFPPETEPRPALSAYVPSPVNPAQVPFGWIIHTTEKEVKAAESRSNTPMIFGGFGPPPSDPEAEARQTARSRLEKGLDLSPLWFALNTEIAGTDATAVQKMRATLIEKVAERKQLFEITLTGERIEDRLEKLPDTIKAFMEGLTAALKPALSVEENRALAKWLESRAAGSIPFEQMIYSRADLEAAWYAITVAADLDPARWPALRKAAIALSGERRAILAEVAAGTGKESVFSDQRNRAEMLGDRIVPELQPHLSTEQVERLKAAKELPREAVVGLREPGPGPGGPPGGFPPGPGGMMVIGGPGGAGGPMPFALPFGQQAAEPGSHRSAFIYFDPATKQTKLFDFVQITGRKGGQKVHFHKDRPLLEMTTVALIYEGDTASLVEPLAYEVYRRAGMPVEQSFHVRLWQSGKPAGYFLLIEQPNRAFLRRNRIGDEGNMYKLQWFGGDLVGQHEKHTNRHQGYEDLVAVVDGLQKATGEAQWDFIKKNFAVDEVATYFAVNMVLSHWDGFFNNYFTYHDIGGTGKWMMFPWDQDSTWGLRDMPEGQVFYDMALTFGMNGDNPPANGFGQWRPPGWFSGPLLASPEFRKIFLSRTRQILENVYTEEVFGRIIADMEKRLTPEVKVRAEIEKEDPAQAVARLKSDLDRCLQHLRQRREFLLAQNELKNVKPDAPSKGR